MVDGNTGNNEGALKGQMLGVTAASYAGQEDHTDARVRGTKVINNIVDLQKSEQALFKQLQSGSASMRLNKKEKDDIIQQIQNLVDARKNMFNDLKTNQEYYRSNVKVSHDILTQETDALEIVERELLRARNRIGIINDQRNNRLRLVEINRYFGDKYKHHTLILKYITLLFSLILIITYLYNQGFLPGWAFTTLFVLIGTVGLFYIIKEIWDAYSRDNMIIPAIRLGSFQTYFSRNRRNRCDCIRI